MRLRPYQRAVGDGLGEVAMGLQPMQGCQGFQKSGFDRGKLWIKAFKSYGRRDITP